ncbi:MULTISPECIES: methionine adenosyltransferase [unclassified Thioalkalivibrio]|uniref:methionine adenosyltransferase n=1 Tax=unclassified Thioalkalivibrio TaxID=2621013 RepID=UPI000360330D|nr:MULTISPECIES: methionine adenosyltransferase [unclassified Thioalkalivibrio]
MFFSDGLFTSESVSAGHPDKACDQISDAILDAFLALDPHARVACEAFAIRDKVSVAGEFRTAHRDHYETVRESAEALVRDTLKAVGYRSAESDIDPDSCEVEIRFNRQSPEIAGAVDGGLRDLGAGDQGMMFGHATDETDHLMPLPWALATDLVARGAEIARGQGIHLLADAKSQVTVAYENGKPSGVQAVVLSWQHDPAHSIDEIREFLSSVVVGEIIPNELRLAGFRTLANPGGAWSVGGPRSDTGLTGRKIMVDTYGGACPHGGGAFSGKDPSKVDRSGAYAARYVAKHVVAAGFARRCTVQLSYAIGEVEPVSIGVDLHGTGAVPEHLLVKAIREVFDLTPVSIIEELKLNRPVYQDTARLGHFGPYRTPALHQWESLTRLEDIRSALRA